jgi:acyl carrier protein
LKKDDKKIHDAVVEAVARIFRKDVSELTPDVRFLEDLKAKSINIVELVAVLQDQFQIEIPMMKVRRQKTIGEAVAFIAELVRGG